MQFKLYVLFYLICLFSYSQDTIMSSKELGKKWQINSMLNYRVYLGAKTYDSNPHPSLGLPEDYYLIKVFNTFGFDLGINRRYYFSKKKSIQIGFDINYRTEKRSYYDSLNKIKDVPLFFSNETTIPLNFVFAYNYGINRITLSSGILCPIIGLNYGHRMYEDGSKYIYSKRFALDNFYLSENLQYKLFKNYDIYLNIGLSVSHKVFFNDDDYKLLFNSGFVFLMEKNKKTPVNSN